MMAEKISRQVIVSDLLITELRDRFYAESLLTETGVRLHFDIPWCDMPYYKHYRDTFFGGEVWVFSSVPFKVQYARD